MASSADTPPDASQTVARTRVPDAIDGARLRDLVVDATGLLGRHVAALNAINVFPVPDGDTGTNMHLTLRAAVDELAGAGDAIDEAAGALAQGALMGARGNSGVILSQVLRGFAAGLAGTREAGGDALARAFASASDAAYQALSEPVEGTILTVIRETSEGLASERPATAEAALACAASAARASADRTPELLPALKEAGVVDAGGLGLAIFLEGLARSLRGDDLDVVLAEAEEVDEAWRDETASAHEGAAGERGYCTEFVVHGPSLDIGAARERLASAGTSLLVVGDGDLLRVHLHTTAPDEVLAYGRTLGEVSRVKVDNLEAQIRGFVSAALPSLEAGSIDVVAVAAGAGIEAVMRSVGATQVVRGGQTMNPSAAEILEAIEACPADEVIVLPNNKNVIAAAEQAAGRTTKRVAVVPSRSIPQGVAALLALNADLPFEANTAAFERALSTVRSAEVTRAVRSTTANGHRVEVGQPVGIVDGSLDVVAGDIGSAVRACIDRMLTPEAGLLTLYAGEDARDDDARALADELRGRYPALEVELVAGGQPHYPYLISLE